MSLEGWGVREVARAEAQAIVVANHYLHRKAPCSRAFGLYDAADNLRGVIMYGMPASPMPRRGLAGRENEHLVGELTRLWCDDFTPRNAESFLIGRTLKRSGYELILSFAEIAAGRRGIVYQATNWLYTGLSSKHTDWVLDGDTSGHVRHRLDAFGGIKKAREALGDRLQSVERPRKHRYVFVNARGGRRKLLISQIKYPILPYPKGEVAIAEEKEVAA